MRRKPVLLLLVVLAVLLAAYVDWRARRLSQWADNRLSTVGAPTDQASVHSTLQREPSTVSDAEGGFIERYDYRSGIPGRWYTLRVAYRRDADGKLVYVAHNLNDRDGEARLQQQLRED